MSISIYNKLWFGFKTQIRLSHKNYTKLDTYQHSIYIYIYILYLLPSVNVHRLGVVWLKTEKSNWKGELYNH